MDIKFGNLKEDIKNNFYLAGHERQVENKLCSVIAFNDKYPNKMFVQLENETITRYVDIDNFESVEIIGG